MNYKYFMPNIENYKHKNINVKYDIKVNQDDYINPYLSCMMNVNIMFEMLNDLNCLNKAESINNSNMTIIHDKWEKIDDKDFDTISKIIDDMMHYTNISLGLDAYREYHLNKSIKGGRNIKLFNALPSPKGACTSLIPGYITITTTSLLSLLKPKDFEKLTTKPKIKDAIWNKVYNALHKFPSVDKIKLKEYLNDSKLSIKYFAGNGITFDEEKDIKNIISCRNILTVFDYVEIIGKEAIWNKVFNLNKSFFRKKNKEFFFHIQTDGISCSVLFQKKVPKDKHIECIKNTYDTLKNSRICSIKKEFYETKSLTVNNKKNLTMLTKIKKNYVKEINNKFFDKMKRDITKFINMTIKNFKNGIFDDYVPPKKSIKNKPKKKSKKIRFTIKEDIDKYIEKQNVKRLCETKNYVVIDPLIFFILKKSENKFNVLFIS